MTENNTPAEATTPTPRPGPLPGPRPGPRPTPRPSAVRPAVAAVTVSDPARWGRVDEDGTAWVRSADGTERKIGSWQAGDPAEGLAHFGRRYDDFATEIELLEARLAGNPAEAKHIRTSAEALLTELPDAAMIGDLAALEKRLAALVTSTGDAEVRAKESRETQRAAATARKTELAEEAEQLGESSTQWKQAGDRLRAILDEWKTIRGVDRKTDDALWKRFSRAREAFNRRRGAHFAELDRTRAAAKRVKEELIERAEALSSSTEWNSTAAAYRDLMTEWKEAGRAPRDADDKLWARFKAAQDTFFAARNAAGEERDAELSVNGEAKSALLDEFEPRVDPAKGIEHARAQLRDLQARWDEIGHVPRSMMHDLEKRLRAIERRVQDAADAEWKRTDPEAQARAAQFRDKVASFEEQAARLEKAGKTKDAEKARAQATQWREWAEAAEGALNG